MRLTDALVRPEPPPGLWLLAGPPASGKSTFRRTWWRGPVVNPDQLRLRLMGTLYDRRREGLVWLQVTRQVGRALREEGTVLLDATNLTRAQRQRWVRLAREMAAPAYAIAAWDPGRVPPEELLRRNATRPEPVPEDRLRAMAEAWQPPRAAEGFAAVWQVIGGG